MNWQSGDCVLDKISWPHLSLDNVLISVKHGYAYFKHLIMTMFLLREILALKLAPGATVTLTWI